MSTAISAASLAVDPAAPNPNQKTHAMLVRGRLYVLRDIEYHQDVPTPVTPEDIRHLKRHAVDSLRLEGEQENQLRQKFKFLTAEQAEVQRLKNVAEGAPDDSIPIDDEDEEEEDVVAEQTPRKRGRPSFRGNS